MASQKPFFRRTDESNSEYDTSLNKDRKSQWKTVEERFKVSQKQSAWIEDEVSELPPSTSRGRFALEITDHSLPEATKSHLSLPVGEKVKGKKGKKIGKKKGRIHELESLSRPIVGEEKGGGDADVMNENVSMKHLPYERSRRARDEHDRRTGISAHTSSDLGKGEYGNSEDDTASFTMHTMVSTPTTQRQSVSWSPSPIPRRGRSSLPPLPELAEELIQRNLKRLKATSARSDADKDYNMKQESVGKKKKKRKKINSSTTVSEHQGVKENVGEEFELTLLKSEKLKSKKSKMSTDQRDVLENESSFNEPTGFHLPTEKLCDLISKDAKSGTKRKKAERNAAPMAIKSKNIPSDKSSESEGINEGTYSISPKKDAGGVISGPEDATGDEESDAILDEESAQGDEEIREGDEVEGDKVEEDEVEGEEEGAKGESSKERRGSSTKLLTMEHLGLGGVDSYPVGWEISSSPDVLWSKKDALEWERDMYFYPSSRRAPIKERLPPDCNEPSFLGGDELLPVKPPISTANLARIENRILAEDSKHWFGEDGELLALPNPIRCQSLRPLHVPLSSSSWDLPVGLLTEYRPALTGAFGKGYEDGLYEVISGDIEMGGVLTRSKRKKGCLLEVELLSIEFSHHPLFSKEHVLAQRLLSLWTEWESRREASKAKVLAEIVEKLRAEKRQLVADLTNLQREHTDGGEYLTNESQGLKESSSTGSNAYNAIESHGSDVNGLKEQLHLKLEELQKTRIERDLEGKEDRKTLEAVLFAWRDLKLLRREQGYAVTPLRLYIRAEGIHKRKRKLGKYFWGYASDVSGNEDGRLTSRRDEKSTTKQEEVIGKVDKNEKRIGKNRKKLVRKRGIKDVENLSEETPTRMRRERSRGDADVWVEDEVVNAKKPLSEKQEEEICQSSGDDRDRADIENRSQRKRIFKTLKEESKEIDDTEKPESYKIHDDEFDGEIFHPSEKDRKIKKDRFCDKDRGKKKKTKKHSRMSLVSDSHSSHHDMDLQLPDDGVEESLVSGADTRNSYIGDGELYDDSTQDLSKSGGEKQDQPKMSSRQRRRQKLKSFYLAELAAAKELSGLSRETSDPSDVGEQPRPVPAPRKLKDERKVTSELSTEIKTNGASVDGEMRKCDGVEVAKDEGKEEGEDDEVDEVELVATEWREWQKEVEKEVEERMEEAQATWELEMENYRITLEEWDMKNEMAEKKKSKRRQKRAKEKMKERRRRRSKKTEKAPLTSHSGDEDDACESDAGTNDEEWLEEKPVPPVKVDPRTIRFEVEEVMKASRRPPGEPRLILKLLKDVTDAGKIPCAREKERRFAVELTEIQARMLYNGQEACHSKAVPLTQAFSTPLDHAFAIRGLGPPESLAVELYERVRGHSAIGTATGGWYPLALIHLPIPSSKKTLKEDTLPELIEFGNDKVVAYSHAGVGSGIFFNPFPEMPDSNEEDRPNLCLHLSGGIWCRLGWGVNQNGVVLSPRGQNYECQSEGENQNLEEVNAVRKLLKMFQQSVGRAGWIGSENSCRERLRQWAEDAKSKAYSHSNNELFQLIEEWSTNRFIKSTYFRLDPLMEEYTFRKVPMEHKNHQDNQKRDSEEWWMSSKRLRILHLRDKGVPEFRGLCCVPLNDREIPTDIFHAYENRISSQLTYNFTINDDVNSTASDSFMSKVQRGWERFKGESGGCDPHEARREWGRKFLQQARYRLLQQSHLARKQQRRLSDLVIEEQVPTMGSLGMTLLEWVKPKRPLRPIRRSWLGSSLAAGGTGGTCGANPPGSSSREVKVKVNVVRAFGVPVRRDIDPIMDSSPWHSPASSSRPWQWEQQEQSQSDHGLAEVPVRPFVEVALGTARARTTTALGVNPTWNQELQLTLNLETSILERTKNKKSSSVFGILDNSVEDLDAPTWWTSNGDINSIEDLYLSILLKDETVVDLLVDSRAREAGEIHHRTQQHFLASLRIPLSTLRYNHRLEGTFRLSSPAVLLGYTSEDTGFESGPISGSSRLLPLIGSTSGLQPGAIYLTLFITVQPPLPALHVAFEDERALESIELPHVESHLRAWEMDVFRTMNHGCCPPKALVPDLGGRTVCATRFFRPLPPPPGLIMKSKKRSEVMAADWLARFVSMIPLSTGHQLTDIWLNSEQMLRLLCGSRVDHGILLACLFLHLGLEVWLAQGSGLPDGPNCTFVLTKGCGKGLKKKRSRKDAEDEGNTSEDGRNVSSSRRRWGGNQSDDEGSEEYEVEDDSDWWVWDPVTGQRFLIRDPFSPLQHLWCLINDQNIWANVQQVDQPQHMNFNLEVGRDWWPAFSHIPPSNGLLSSLFSFLPAWFGRMETASNKEIQAPSPVVGSVQPEDLPYESRAATLSRYARRKGGKRKGKDDKTLEDCPDLYLKLLEEKLENHLQSCIMHWRKNNLTIWNRHGSALLRKLLPRLEHPMVGSSDHSVDESHLWELKSLMSSHKVCGFPINVPYDGMGSAREALRTTGVHTINEPGVEFALAVYLHPYCGIKGESSSILSLWVYVASLVNRRLNLD